jgi:hypothetical protein
MRGKLPQGSKKGEARGPREALSVLLLISMLQNCLRSDSVIVRKRYFWLTQEKMVDLGKDKRGKKEKKKKNPRHATIHS